MKIRYVAPIDKNMASNRYRALIPGGILAGEGHEVSIGPPEKGWINIYSKHFNREAMLAGILDTGGVFDICDDHFNTPELRDYYIEMCRRASVLTCNSEAMADVIKTEVGREPYVVPDPYEFDEIEPKFWDLSMGLWFGNRLNLKSLQEVELDCDLEVVSGFDRPSRSGAVRNTPWSLESMDVAFRRNEFAIFPVAGHTRKIEAKSKNRIINAIRGGLLCFCHPVGGYDPLDEHCVISEDLLGSIRDVRKLAENNPTAVVRMVKDGQDYIRELYSPQAITNQWKGIYDEAEHWVRS